MCTFTSLYLRLQEELGKSNIIIGRPRIVSTPQLKDQVQTLRIIEEHPEISTRKIAQQVNVSYQTVWNDI